MNKSYSLSAVVTILRGLSSRYSREFVRDDLMTQPRRPRRVGSSLSAPLSIPDRFHEPTTCSRPEIRPVATNQPAWLPSPSIPTAVYCWQAGGVCRQTVRSRRRQRTAGAHFYSERSFVEVPYLPTSVGSLSPTRPLSKRCEFRDGVLLWRSFIWASSLIRYRLESWRLACFLARWSRSAGWKLFRVSASAGYVRGLGLECKFCVHRFLNRNATRGCNTSTTSMQPPFHVTVWGGCQSCAFGLKFVLLKTFITCTSKWKFNDEHECPPYTNSNF